jgi:hypothetical protein
VHRVRLLKSPSLPFLHRIDAIHPLCKMAFNPSGCIQRVGSVAANGIRTRNGLLRE